MEEQIVARASRRQKYEDLRLVVHRYVLVLCIRNRLYRSRFKVIISGSVDYNDYLWIIKYDNNARMDHPYDGGR